MRRGRRRQRGRIYHRQRLQKQKKRKSRLLPEASLGSLYGDGEELWELAVAEPVGSVSDESAGDQESQEEEEEEEEEDTEGTENVDGKDELGESAVPWGPKED